MKIVTIIGARPQFVKAAVVSRAVSEFPQITEVIIHTGQHFDKNMSDVFFEEMAIPKPNINLQVNGLDHGAMTGQMLQKIEEVLKAEKPDWVLVYGDTNSTLAGALAAAKLHIKVAHVEAGLRSYNMRMPEEVNRILTDRISNKLFCPTQTAVDNLVKEGYENIDTEIILCGDVMQDAAKFYLAKAKAPSTALPDKFILATIHRAENTDDTTKLLSLFKGLENVSDEIPVILPVHPRTKKKLEVVDYDFTNSKIHFIDPVGYLEMVYLLQNCEMVITDSGGLQKEAYFFEKNCVTLRNETEWSELIENGYNILTDIDVDSILRNYRLMAERKNDFSKKLYGDSNAGNRILQSLIGS